MLASGVGSAAMIGLLYVVGQVYGFSAVSLLYLQPYLWANRYILAITLLYHTHPKPPKYDMEAWALLRGASIATLASLANTSHKTSPTSMAFISCSRKLSFLVYIT